MPRSEVSERHRAGSWVWVVPKSRLEVWESLNCPPTKWGYWLASHENPGTGENTERSGKVIVVVVVVVVGGGGGDDDDA